MGTSTDAILFYGVLVGEDGEAPWCTDENGDYTDDDHVEAATRLLDEAEVGGDVWVGTHCSYSAPHYYLTIKEYSAWRGQALNIESLKTPTGVRALKKACEILGVEHRPGWYLVSLWGV